MRSPRGGLFTSIVVAVFLTATLPALGQEERWVDAGVCPGTGIGAVDDPYCTIQEAICELKDVPAGGTVHVLPGTYQEAIRSDQQEDRKCPGSQSMWMSAEDAAPAR